MNRVANNYMFKTVTATVLTAAKYLNFEDSFDDCAVLESLCGSEILNHDAVANCKTQHTISVLIMTAWITVVTNGMLWVLKHHK